MEAAFVPSTHSSLIRALCAGDEEGWRRFVERYQPVIVRWCREGGLNASDADDVTAEVLVKLFEHIGSYRRERGLFRVWLKTVVENARREHARNLRRRNPEQGGPAFETRIQALRGGDPSSVVDEVDALAKEDLDRALAAARSRVEPVTWDVFRLNVLEGRPAREVAATLGLKVAKVYVYKSRVCRMVAEELTKIQPKGESDRDAVS